jgi:hypothetical protein
MLLGNGSGQLMACGWSDDWDGGFYRFFEPETRDLGEFSAFQFTFDRLYDYKLLEPENSATANLASWAKYLGPNYPLADIRKIVYETKLDQLNSIRKGLNNNKSLPRDVSDNAIARDWAANKRLDLLDYLILAHQAEPLCNYGMDEWTEEEPDMGSGQSIIEAAKMQAQKVQDSFLKLRYGYQALRLEQYTDQQAEATETYKRFILPVAQADPLIALWSRSHYAGCLRALGEEAEAAYQFSLVFDQCPSRRIQAWYSWRILSDEIWENAQAKCNGNHELAVLLFLRGFSPSAISMEDMQRMYELEPQSRLLEVLLVREINKYETEILGTTYSNESPVYKRLIPGGTGELQNFVESVLAGGGMHDRNVWELANVYLQFLNGDTQAAMNNLAKKQAQLTGDGLLKGRLLDLVFRIGSAQSIDKDLENAIYKDLTNLSTKISPEEVDELSRFRDDAFGWLYAAKGENAKEILAHNHAGKLLDFPIDLTLVNDMISFNEKEDKTLYEKDLLKRLNSGKDNRDFLLDVKGTGLLGKNLLPEAVKVFSQISLSYRNSDAFALDADPFRPVIKDIVHCENCGKGKYNKLSYTETIMDLQKKITTDPSKSAEYNILLGNAYYNTTFFGASWRTKDFFRSSGSWYSLGERSEYYQFDLATFDELVEMETPKNYYAKAINVSKDKEMAALATFLMAKCELNQFYIDGFNDLDKYRKGFSMLKLNYRKTDAYADLIKECWDLQGYVRN